MSQSILLIDDDKILREIFTMILMFEGYNVFQAENGRRALELLKSMDPKRLPSCMVLDLNMPEMNGDEFLECIETQYAQEFGHIPVIVCSVEGDLDPNRKIVMRLEKPIAMEDLCRAIQKALFTGRENQISG